MQKIRTCIFKDFVPKTNLTHYEKKKKSLEISLYANLSFLL